MDAADCSGVAGVIPTAVLRRAALVAALLCCGPFCRRAHADKKEWTVAVTPGYAVAYVDSRTGNGGGGGVEVGYGITESLSLHASGFLSWHALGATKSEKAGTMSGYASMVGLTYTIDVIRLVPYFELQVGAVGVRGTPEFGRNSGVVKSSDDFAIGLGFGMDYLLTRHVAVGFVVRYHALVTDITRIPVYLYVGPRVTFRFGG